MYLINYFVVVDRKFRDNDSGGARSNSGVESNISRASAHYFNHVASGVGLTGVAESVYHLNYRVHSCIVAYGVIRRCNIVIYRCRYSDAGHAVSGEVGGSSEGAVSAYRHNSVNSKPLAGSNRLRHSLRGGKLGTTVGIKYGSALVDYVGNISHFQRVNISVNKT